MVGTLVYGRHGHLFEVSAPEPLRTRIRTALATLRAPGAEPVGRYALTLRQREWHLRWDDEPVGSRPDPDGALLLLHWHINQRTIATSSQARTTVHAALAQSPAGEGVLLAAPMESGKTTTVTGLLRAGWDFLTDEAAALDPDGTAWAYPKPLTLDRGSWRLFPELDPGDVAPAALSWLVPATRTGARVVPSTQVRMVVLPAYRGGEPTRHERVPPSQAALVLAQSAFHLDRHGARDLGCVSALARSVPTYRLVVGDLAEAVQAISELAARPEVAA